MARRQAAQLVTMSREWRDRPQNDWKENVLEKVGGFFPNVNFLVRDKHVLTAGELTEL